MTIETLQPLLPHVQAAGRMALDLQQRGALQKRIKGDGSIVTQADTQVEDLLLAQLAALYPEANILTEETVLTHDPDKAYTFALDPIDGTEVYSRGMAGWCVSLGLLDRDLVPIAGIIYAPRMDLLVVADVGQEATVNGHPAGADDVRLPLSGRSNLMVTSTIHRYLDLRRYPGKIRSIGSAEFHLASPVIYPEVVGGIQMPSTYIWDIAAAHAINRSVGYFFEYYSGQAIDYSGMIEGGQAQDLILAGSEPALTAMRETLTRL